MDLYVKNLSLVAMLQTKSSSLVKKKRHGGKKVFLQKSREDVQSEVQNYV